MRRFPFIVFAAIVYLLGMLLINQTTPQGRHADGVDKPLPIMAITTMDGSKPWNAEALKGRVTVLNFFASWCSPCAKEMPELRALKKQFPSVRLEGIAWNDSVKTLTPWLKEHHNPFDEVWLDTRGDATIALGIRGIPETIIVDANGVVRYRLSGGLIPIVREGEVSELIRELLAEAGNAK